MSTNRVEKEKNFTSSLISALSTLQDAPTRSEVEEKAASLATVFGYDGKLDPIIEEAMIAVDTRMGAGVSLIDVEAEHDEEWVHKREDISWTYTDAYESYLKQERWHPNVVQSLSDVGTRILGHLQDPKSEGEWDRRGLVIGHVQSGKTANYLGLIGKAADAGYKFIIVIAGIHNNLRKQTQERIDEGFVGRSSDPENRTPVGVGRMQGYPHPATLTNIYDDFNKKTAAQSGWELNDFSKPIILVIKKNVSTLKSLHSWLSEMNAKGGRIADVPMLMIDDEADNASINTNKDDLDPTKTNAMIRRILGLFMKSCYVGYTATPFANIFINPESYDEDVREELFPRDFIYCLDAPNTYFGPEKVFLDEDTSATILEPITDCEEYLPFTHKKDHELFELPPSLYRAINQFIIVRTIRNLRGQKNKHCSMMVNVSRFVNIQQGVRNFISVYEKKLKDAVKANYAMPESVSSKNAYMADLKGVFEGDFSHCGFSWAEIKAELNDACESVRLFVVNSKSDEVLDYKKYERGGQGLTAIAIGGLSLSRGLTIEGLCISYMYRNTRMYDTLMQMGRWFGYRPGFEDLCRVHLSPDSIDWYAHIAEASEELRQQIKRMRRNGLSPKQFGLYVQSHQESLLITAANKMRSGEKIIVSQDYSGDLVESTFLPVDDETNQENEILIEAFWKDAFGCQIYETAKGWYVKDVKIELIEEFLLRFKTLEKEVFRKSSVIEYLEAIAEKYPLGDVLLISKKPDDPTNYRLGAQERTAKKATETGWRLSGYRLASKGDEKLGLTEEQLAVAQQIADEDRGRNNAEPSDTHFRHARNKPLLMVHCLTPTDNPALRGLRIPAYGVSFPYGAIGTSVEVVANRIWIEQMLGGLVDSPDEEEDYDE
jgi:hypothetical protein